MSMKNHILQAFIYPMDAVKSSDSKSSLGREAWERRPIIRSIGFHYQTVVDVLLVDISQSDKFALDSINNFFATQNTNLYGKDGELCREVARLIFADFPTSLLVDGLGPIPLECISSKVAAGNVY
ncbi:hypothetical protein GOP47_0018684 [Adiantum capillus-veneris]|uniref:Uncharacterized protein n=1 Tax=Adiantum capillus-veneris TaxID=13818 RepID=A0A9D4UE09_ADICA|nr:hypothetical protein GOP47_0018684 [Adiantum capillus-veneris]